MKRNLKLALLSTVIFIASANAQSNDLEKAAIKLNNAAAQGQQIINGAEHSINTIGNTIETVGAVKETAGKVFKALGFGKKKDKNKMDDVAVTSTSVTTTNTIVTPPPAPAPGNYVTIYFDKIEYKKFTEIYDVLNAFKQFTEVKKNFSTGNTYLKVQYTGSSDAALNMILEKWGSSFEVEADEAEVKKLKAKL